MIVNEFFNFLKNNNIGSTIIATVLSTHITDLTTSFADDLIMPIFNYDEDGYGKADISKLKDLKIVYKGISINLAKFCLTLIKVLVIFIILLLFKKYGNFY